LLVRGSGGWPTLAGDRNEKDEQESAHGAVSLHDLPAGATAPLQGVAVRSLFALVPVLDELTIS